MQTTKRDLNKTLWPQTDAVQRARKWVQFDAKGKILGKLAKDIADYLMGKNKAYYSDHIDCGDFVVVQNVAGMVVTGKKETDKFYYFHSGYRGNMKKFSYEEMMKKDPTKVLFLAVKGMLPKNGLRDGRLKRLKMFAQTSTKFDYLSPENK